MRDSSVRITLVKEMSQKNIIVCFEIFGDVLAPYTVGNDIILYIYISRIFELGYNLRLHFDFTQWNSKNYIFHYTYEKFVSFWVIFSLLLLSLACLVVFLLCKDIYCEKSYRYKSRFIWKHFSSILMLVRKKCFVEKQNTKDFQIICINMFKYLFMFTA